MKSLYLRIWLTIVATLLLFAFGSGWLFQRQIEQERSRSEAVVGERMNAWAELIQRGLPSPEAPREEQTAALLEWSQRLRIPLALDATDGARIAASEIYTRRQAEGARALPVKLDDGRTLWVMRAGMNRAARARPGEPPLLPGLPPNMQRGVGFVVLLAVLFVAVAIGAYPVVRALTRRLEALKHGVERFGAGALDQRVAVSGRDEVAAVASSFNDAAAHVESLVRSHQSLLANASHELRSPLARLKMAVLMLDQLDTAAPEQRERLQREIATNIAELDALVDEVLLASRLDAKPRVERHAVDLLALAAEEAARVDAQVEGAAAVVGGDERLLRRALRNLLENARRYGGGEVSVLLGTEPRSRAVEVRVLDRGPGVPEHFRERIFEAFFRLPGHAEQAGGVGLGLSLVRQIMQAHGGSVRCEPREGGGSAFVMALPASA